MDQDVWMRCQNIGSTGQPAGSGLECLAELDLLLVKQHRRRFGDCSSGGSKFTVKNRYGEKVYFAEEEIACNCEKSWDVTAFDAYGRPSVHMYRPMVCCACQCQPIDVEVCSPPGNVIGSITHMLSWFSSKFILKNAAGDVMLYIRIPFRKRRLGRDVEFLILGADEQTVKGMISKQWTGAFQSFHNELDSFGVSFPADLDVSMKAVVLAACLLIDYSYYDRRHND